MKNDNKYPVLRARILEKENEKLIVNGCLYLIDENNQGYELDGLAVELCQMMNGIDSLGQIYQKLINTHNLDSNEIEEEFLVLINDLEAEGLIALMDHASAL